MTNRTFPRDLAIASEMSLLDAFRDPPVAYRPVPFWSWNEAIDPEEVRRQADLLAEGGLGGGFIHVRVGLTTPYMGRAWWAAVDAAVDQCRQRGLKIWFYDEDRWPSGYSAGAVPLASEAFRMKGLLARAVEAPVPDDCVPIGAPVDGLQVYAWTAPLGNDWFHGTCYGDLLSRDAMAKFLEEAYASYHARYGHLYGTDVLAEFTDEPNAMHRSRLPRGLLPHTTQLAERFTEMHGYDPVPQLHLLFAEGPCAGRFRLHYFRTINDLFENSFSKQLGDWCREHGIAFTGHYMAEHTCYEQQLWGVKVMANYRHQDVPGIDHLFRQVSETVTAKQCQSVVNQYAKPRMLSELYGVAGGSLTFADRWWIASQQMCLGVNLLNPHLLLYTMSGCRKRDYPQNLFYQQPWWPLNRVIDEPLSRVCVALSRGRYVAEALIVHPQESAFVHWRTRSDRHSTDRGEKLKWEFEPVTPEVKPTIDALSAQLEAIMVTLFGAQRTFDYGDETLLADDGSVTTTEERPALRIGQMNYPAVIVPSMTTIAATTLTLLEQFQAAGGNVIRCGVAPTLLDGEPSTRLDQWTAALPTVTAAELPTALAGVVSPAVRAIDVPVEDAAKLYVHVRDIEDGERLVFLTNLHRTRSFETRVSLAGGFAFVERLDPITGDANLLTSTREANELAVTLPFAEAESHLLRLRRGQTDTSRMPAPARAAVRQRLAIPTASWTGRRLDDNALTIDTAQWREGETAAWSTHPAPILAIQQRLNQLKYDGPLGLRSTFRVAGLSAGRKAQLVVEHPERYSIRVNKSAVAYEGLPHYRDIRWLPIDVTELIREGENVIELTCNFRHGDLRNVHDPFGRYGTEIESMYLVGDFDVVGESTGELPVGEGWLRVGLPTPLVEEYRAGSLIVTDPRQTLTIGNTTSQGLPHYAGRIEFHARLPGDVLTTGGRLWLAIERLDCPVASVAVAGEIVGHFAVAPFEVDLTEAVRRGGDAVTITLYGTLRNLMGAHHRANGEEPSEHPHTFEPSYPEGANVAEWVRKWGDEGRPDVGWREDYTVVSFGDVGKMTVVVR